MGHKIIGISGSLRSDSCAYYALDLAMKKVAAQGWKTEILDLRLLDLPFCNGGKDYPKYPDVERLREAITSAQGIILSTPEYHGSTSGVLKNALDLIDIQHVRGKVFALISVLGGGQSTSALHTLRSICRHLYAWAIPDQLAIPYAEKAFDADGQLIDKQLDQRLDAVVASFLSAVQTLSK